MVRQHPQWQRARALVQQGHIGEPSVVQVMFSCFHPDPAKFPNQADIGGGALNDIGCYAIVAARYLFGAEPLRAVSLVDRDPGMKIDRISSGLVDFLDGRQLVFTCGMQLMRYQRCICSAPRGGLKNEIPFNAPPGKPAASSLKRRTAEMDHGSLRLNRASVHSAG